MKKLLSLIVFLLVAGCLFSCAPTTKNSDRFISPSDEESAVYTVTQTDGNGLKLEVTLHGYKSESLGKEFYVKNNEYFLADVKLTNESSTPVYQWLPTACREMSPAHNHEIKFDIANGDYKLNSSSFGFACPERTDLWTVEPGASYEWQLKLAAGDPHNTLVSWKPEENAPLESGTEEVENGKRTAVNEETEVSTYIYASGFMQGGNFQIYESTYVAFGSAGTGIYGSDFIIGANGTLGSSYQFVVNGSFSSIMGILPSDGDSNAGILLYKDALFPDNVCTFEGPVSFSYMKSSDGTENNLSVSVPLSIEVVYVSPNVAAE